MNIYEIEQAILELADPETGEITDFDALDKLVMARDEKVENVALWHKNLVAESKAIREEEKNLADRRKAAEAKAENLKVYLDRALHVAKFSSPRVSIGYRKSTAVEITDECKFVATAPSAYLTAQQPKINRTAITEALKGGAIIDGAALVERNNIQVR